MSNETMNRTAVIQRGAIAANLPQVSTMSAEESRSRIAGTLLPEADTKARALLPLLLDAGYAPEAEHDDYVCVRDPDSGFALFLTDFGGHRLELRCYFKLRRELDHETRESYARQCSEKLWAKYLIDADGDLVVSHVVCCAGGLHQPNLMRTVRSFLGLCVYTLRECDPDGVVSRGDDDAADAHAGE